MADVALFDAVVSGDPRPLPAQSLVGVRLDISKGYWFEGLEPEVERLTDQALRKLRESGVIIVEAEVPGLAALIDEITDQVQNHDVRSQLAQYLASYGAHVSFDEVVRQASPDIRATFADLVLPGAKGFVSEDAYHLAVHKYLPRLKQTFRDYFAHTQASAIVFPTTMVTAPRIGDEAQLTVRGKSVRFDIAVARNIAPGSSAGLPGLVLPVGLASDGLPVALEFDGPQNSDRALLSLGLAMESVLGKMPPPSM